MSALRWLFATTVAAAIYVTYLTIAAIVEDVPGPPPGGLNAAILLLLEGAIMTLGLNDLSARRHRLECARLDRIDERLDTIESRLTDHGGQIGEITRELPSARGVATLHFSRTVAVGGGASAVDPKVIELGSRLARRLNDDD